MPPQAEGLAEGLPHLENGVLNKVRRGTSDPLRELLRREVEAFAADLVQARDGIPAERTEALDRLAKFVALRDSLQPRSRNWWPAAVFAGTLGILSILLFARIRETEIELEASVGQVSFELSKDQVLSASMELASLGIVGAREVRFPDSGRASEQVETQSAADSALFLTPSSVGERRGTVTLAPLPLPSGAAVRLRWSEIPRHYRLSTMAPGLTVQATLFGPVVGGFAGSPPRRMDFLTPRPVLLQAGSEPLDLDLAFAATPPSAFSPQLAVRDLSFLQVDQFLDADHSMVRRLSTILSGTLYFESLNGQERRLRAGEELRFEQSQGEIRTIELADNRIALKFHGRVRGMTTGTGEGRRSLMPTWLEWLRARHGLPLLWASALYLFGVIASVLRWWGVRM
jgi:hypothetical protein